MDNERQQIYYIPENYLNESRVFQGQFRLRYLIEGGIMAGIIGLIAWLLLPPIELQARITLMVVICAPFLLAGLAGFNGDPLSVALSSAYNWYKNRKLLVYNNTPRLLSQSPLEGTFGEELMRDKLVDYFQKRQQERIDRKLNIEMVEGENFEFEEDADVDPYLRKDDGSEDTAVEQTVEEPEDDFEVYIEDDLDDLDVLDELYGSAEESGEDDDSDLDTDGSDDEFTGDDSSEEDLT